MTSNVRTLTDDDAAPVESRIPLDKLIGARFSLRNEAFVGEFERVAACRLTGGHRRGVSRCWRCRSTRRRRMMVGRRLRRSRRFFARHSCWSDIAWRRRPHKQTPRFRNSPHIMPISIAGRVPHAYCNDSWPNGSDFMQVDDRKNRTTVQQCPAQCRLCW